MYPLSGRGNQSKYRLSQSGPCNGEKNGNEKDLEAITVLILVQASKNADGKLKDMVIHMRQSNSKSDNYKSTAAILVENKSNIAETVSSLMKEISGSPEMVMDKFK